MNCFEINLPVNFLAVLALLTGSYFASAEGELSCSTEKLGRLNTIQCNIDPSFTQIAWSYSGQDTQPLVRYDKAIEQLQGPGHDNGTYSIRIDGALLIIDEGSVTRGKNYTIEVINEQGDESTLEIESPLTTDDLITETAGSSTHYQEETTPGIYGEITTACPRSPTVTDALTESPEKCECKGNTTLKVALAVTVIFAVALAILAFGLFCYLRKVCCSKENINGQTDHEASKDDHDSKDGQPDALLPQPKEGEPGGTE